MAAEQELVAQEKQRQSLQSPTLEKEEVIELGEPKRDEEQISGFKSYFVGSQSPRSTYPGC